MVTNHEGSSTEETPNIGLQPTAYNLRSYLAPVT
jgi:hypothetical protein